MGLNKRPSNKVLPRKSNGRLDCIEEKSSKAQSSGVAISQSSSRRERRSCSQKVFVQHKYTDHLGDPIFLQIASGPEEMEPRRSQPNTTFPEMLHNLLTNADANGFGDIVSWQPHGRSFLVHKKKVFVDQIIPRFFHQTKLTSFQRQLNLYGFVRLTTGPDRSGYYHELFLRGRPDLCKQMIRTRIKGNGMKAASSPSTEPNFYKMKFCPSEVSSPGHSDHSPQGNCVDSVNEQEPTSGEQEDDEPSDIEEDYCEREEYTPLEENESSSHTSVKSAPRNHETARIVDKCARTMSITSHSDSSTCSTRGSDSGYSSTGDDGIKEVKGLVTNCERTLLSVIGPSNGFSHFRPYASSSSLSTDGVQQAATNRIQTKCIDCAEMESDPNQRFQNGDIVYFEGHKFRYLDHLAVDELVDLIVGLQPADVEGSGGSDLAFI